MSDFMNNYFGPMHKDACIYFYILSIIFATLFLLIIISTIIGGIRHYRNNRLNVMYIFSSIYMLFITYVAYYQSRLLHTMCVNSVV